MPKKVLVVDDEPNILLSLQYLMQRAGYLVETAADGEAALQCVAAAPPDLILLDVSMPKRDGYDVCQTLRANADWNTVRVIMVTARGRDVDREKGIALGADEYITKPFSSQLVLDKVQAILGK